MFCPSLPIWDFKRIIVLSNILAGVFVQGISEGPLTLPGFVGLFSGTVFFRRTVSQPSETISAFTVDLSCFNNTSEISPGTPESMLICPLPGEIGENPLGFSWPQFCNRLMDGMKENHVILVIANP